MAVNLEKGEKIALEKGLKNVVIGLGWDPDDKEDAVSVKKEESNIKKGLFGLLGTKKKKEEPKPPKQKYDWDLDSAIVCYGGEAFEYLVYFGDKIAYNGAIVHGGDNLTGEGPGDDERISVDLSHIPDSVDRLRVVVNIFNAKARGGQHFGRVKKSHVHILDGNNELLNYPISDNSDFEGKTGLIVADLVRKNGVWTFCAIGDAVNIPDLRMFKTQKLNEIYSKN